MIVIGDKGDGDKGDVVHNSHKYICNKFGL